MVPVLSHGTLLYTPSNTLADPHDILMIARIRGRLIQHTNRLLVQLHEVSLESQVADVRLIFLSSTPIVLKEERQAARRVEVCALDRHLLDI